MLCYRDMTFCDYKCCAKFDKCDRALTDKVYTDAEKWMHGGPICIYAEKPVCYTDLDNHC